MIGVVVVTHGQLATELLNAAETIVGDLPRFAAVSIGWHDDVEEARAEIAGAIARVSGGEGAIVLTDMFGGTASNLAITLVEEGRVEVVTGVNLPMLLKLAGIREPGDVRTVARRVSEDGRAAIRVASDLLRGEGQG
jgi:PTS system mannose-specific IIA component